CSSPIGWPEFQNWMSSRSIAKTVNAAINPTSVVVNPSSFFTSRTMTRNMVFTPVALLRGNQKRLRGPAVNDALSLTNNCHRAEAAETLVVKQRLTVAASRSLSIVQGEGHASSDLADRVSKGCSSALR